MEKWEIYSPEKISSNQLFGSFVIVKTLLSRFFFCVGNLAVIEASERGSNKTSVKMKQSKYNNVMISRKFSKLIVLATVVDES